MGEPILEAAKIPVDIARTPHERVIDVPVRRSFNDQKTVDLAIRIRWMSLD